MAFNNGFQGDYVSLNTIIKTHNAKSYFIPGITANPATQVTAMGEVAFLYTKGALTAAGAHNLGDKIDLAVKGGKRIDISLAKGSALGFIIPGVNHETVSADIVTAYLTQDVVRQMNIYNEEGLVKVVADAVAKTFTKGATAYVALTEAMATFKTDNKVPAIKPTGVLASSAFYAKLLQDNKYIRATDRADLKVFDGQAIEVSGVPVIEAPDLVSADFVLVNAEGIAAPVNIRSFKVVDATVLGYPSGVAGVGEMGYNFKVITSTDDASLGSGAYFVAKFTEAA